MKGRQAREESVAAAQGRVMSASESLDAAGK
jgi:hypothetical protein